MRILAVGNHMTILEELERQVSDAFPEAEIIKQTDALMAGKYAFQQGVDMVFAEVNMRRMNGLQLIRFVKREHPTVKGFLFGAQQELSEAFLLVSEDIDGVLTYPPAENAIREACRRGRC